MHTVTVALQAGMNASASGRDERKRARAEDDVSEVLGVSAATWRKEMKDWVMHWQAVLQLQQLPWQERCRIAAQTSMDGVLEFTRVKILNDAEPPSAFKSLHEHLKQQREAQIAGVGEDMVSDGVGGHSAPCRGHQSRFCGNIVKGEQDEVLYPSEAGGTVEDDDVHEPGCAHDTFPVLSEECSAYDLSGQVFLQLMRIVAQEIGLRTSALDIMVLEFEHSVSVA